MEEINPATLTPEQRGKLNWRKAVEKDSGRRAWWLLHRAKNRGHAHMLHRQMFQKPMPAPWNALPWGGGGPNKALQVRYTGGILRGATVLWGWNEKTVILDGAEYRSLRWVEQPERVTT